MISDDSFAVPTSVFCSGACVSDDTWLETHHGPARFRDVQPGDYVLNSDGKFKKIRYLEKCGPHEELPEIYLEISLDNGYSIKITQDHIIGGRSSEQWKVGDPMVVEQGEVAIIEEISETEPFIGCDMILEDESDYIANGFIVESMCRKSHNDKIDAARNMVQGAIETANEGE